MGKVPGAAVPLLALALLLNGSESPSQIQIHFHVTHDGWPVAGLEARDFVLLEDGYSRPIESLMGGLAPSPFTYGGVESPRAPTELIFLFDAADPVPSYFQDENTRMLDLPALEPTLAADRDLTISVYAYDSVLRRLCGPTRD
jgi:hypothetical protein